MYRMSLKEKAEVERQVQELLEQGFVQPSSSLYGALVLFVQKKDGGMRMCLDYRGPNAVTKMSILYHALMISLTLCIVPSGLLPLSCNLDITKLGEILQTRPRRLFKYTKDSFNSKSRALD